MSHHPIRIAAPRKALHSAAPLILDRDDGDFITAMLTELGSPDGVDRLRETQAQDTDAKGLLRLYQPMQRRFHVALIEAWCDVPGAPRIDPSRVEKAGLVLRRRRIEGRGTTRFDGWMKAGGKCRGWVDCAQLGPDGADPQPATRLQAKRTGVAQIDRALASLSSGSDAATLEEVTIPMFVAPPEVCAAQGSTLFYGVVPTASAERADVAPDTTKLFEGFEAGSTAFLGHLVPPLDGSSWTFPAPGTFVDSHWAHVLDSVGGNFPDNADAGVAAVVAANRTRLDQLRNVLRQLVVEFDALGSSPESQALFARLQAIPLTMALRPGESLPRVLPAGSFVAQAADVLLAGEDGSFELPQAWPSLTTEAKQALHAAMHAGMLARFRATQGRPSRFDNPDDVYVLRAFVRLKPEGNCPARTLWSDYGTPFTIAPWYEAAAEPVTIALPNLADRSLLKKMKPNVSFAVPKELQNLLANSAEDLMEGKAGNKGITVGWLCSFSIPVITFCAFIVLNIFLSLFHIFFRWLFFIKICLPYPKAK